MYFPQELWNEIKEFAGIYSISLDWNLLKLKKEELILIIKKYININIENESSYLVVKKNMGSIKKYLIKYFWKNINKKNLMSIYKNYTCSFCPYDYKLYSLNNLYILEKYQQKILFTFNNQIISNNIYIEKFFKIFNITNNFIELISLHQSIDEIPQKIKIKKNLRALLIIKIDD